MRRTLPILIALSLAACGGASTGKRNPAQPPAPAPNADVGQKRAAQEAALATEERVSTQKRTETAAGEQPP